MHRKVNDEGEQWGVGDGLFDAKPLVIQSFISHYQFISQVCLYGEMWRRSQTAQRSDKKKDDWRESFVVARDVIGQAIYRDLFR